MHLHLSSLDPACSASRKLCSPSDSARALPKDKIVTCSFGTRNPLFADQKKVTPGLGTCYAQNNSHDVLQALYTKTNQTNKYLMR